MYGRVTDSCTVRDAALIGHSYAKSPLDMVPHARVPGQPRRVALRQSAARGCSCSQACWDILGKHAKLPVTVLLGGRFGESVPL